MDVAVFKAELKKEFEHMAEWRREKAAERPNDTRNTEAAACLDRLAGTVEACPREVIEAARALLDPYPDSEVWLQKMRGVGFHDWPDTAEEFCQSIISASTK